MNQVNVNNQFDAAIRRMQKTENKKNILQMKALYPRKKVVNDKLMLFSIEDEEVEESSLNNKNYLKVFRKVYKSIRVMSADRNVNKGSFLQSPARLAQII